jgi:hypothetical protein
MYHLKVQRTWIDAFHHLLDERLRQQGLEGQGVREILSHYPGQIQRPEQTGHWVMLRS